MPTLIIYAHPDNEGHCSAVLSEVEAFFRKNKIDYELVDLYKSGFDPLLSGKELLAKGLDDLPVDVKKYQEKIRNSDTLIFIYPVWWNTMPAILKGFIDRVFSRGFAFRYQPLLPSKLRKYLLNNFRFVNRFDYGVPIPMLRGKKAIVLLTTGSPWIGFIITGRRFVKIIKKDALGFFGIRSKVYQIDNCRILNEYQMEKIRKTVRKALRRGY